jgi:hypothetical protein
MMLYNVLLMVHDAVYSYCWYTMLYTATVVHDAVYRTATDDGT